MLTGFVFLSGSGSTACRVFQETKVGGRLEGLVKILGAASSNPKAGGLENLISVGLSREYTHIIDRKGHIPSQQITLLERYKPDRFLQYGFLPYTDIAVTMLFDGLNQHYGPGGRGMYGINRMKAHLRFCEVVREKRPIAVFCQDVVSQVDGGDVVYVRWVDPWELGETAEEMAEGILPIEHEVQVKALELLAIGNVSRIPVPSVAQNAEEVEILEQIRKEFEPKVTAVKGA